jgi:hypothetical protein
MRPLFLTLCLAACGGGDGPSGGDCGFASDRYLPYEAGNSWTYQITDLSTGMRATKTQAVSAVDDPDLGPVLLQVTGKLSGTTKSLNRRDGDRLVRFEQEDYDATGTLERTTTYDPSELRIDESAERVAEGAAWDEAYTEIVDDPSGVEVSRVDTIDHWAVVEGAVSCEAPLGTFECLHLRKTRTAGGVAVKDFFFARGVGKVRESGQSQLEELASCAEN